MKNSPKKILTFFSLIGIISASLITLNPHQTSAVTIDARSGNSCGGFLGFVSWDCGIKNDISNENDLKSETWKIAANIAADITVLAAYLVLGYVIYGGYLYTFSSGDPGKIATGKKTLSQAFIGLAIVMLAYIIMSSIRFALLGSSGDLGNCMTITTADGKTTVSGNCVSATDVIGGAIQWFVAIAGIVSAIFVVYGGISYATSAGDPGKLQKAKNMIIYALIGLAIVALAEIITAFVTNIIKDASNATTSTDSETSTLFIETKNTILKETTNEKIS